MRHLNAHQFNHREQSITATRLSAAAETGSVASTYFDRRHHQLPADWPSPITRFLDRGPAGPAPKPSAASRPMQKRRAANGVHVAHTTCFFCEKWLLCS